LPFLLIIRSHIFNENNHKAEKILEKNNIGISIGLEGWTIAIISIDKPIKRRNFKDTSFSKVVDKAFRRLNSK
jgi:hypothetical protein